MGQPPISELKDLRCIHPACKQNAFLFTDVDLITKMVRLPSGETLENWMDQVDVLNNLPDHPGILKPCGWATSHKLCNVYGPVPLFQFFRDGDLTKWYGLSRYHPRREQWIAQILNQLVSAIFALHERGLCHSDIKPDNVVWSGSMDNPTVRLIDFELVTRANPGEVVRRSKGSQGYVAPEVLHRGADGFCPFAADVYSLGATMYALLFGMRPHESDRVTTDERYGRWQFPRDKTISTRMFVLLTRTMHPNPRLRMSIKELLNFG